jgi:hypothetical protein
MVLAVYIPPQAPAPGQALRTTSKRAASSMRPAAKAPEVFFQGFEFSEFFRAELFCFNLEADEF